MTATPEQITKQLESLSEYHLRLARKQSLLIGQTKFGTLNLSYSGKSYILKSGVASEVIASGAKRVVKEALMSAYQVVA